ncbi:MAG: NHL repeat-containing protein [Planctomycetota bacterium]|jgi:sugar lactone lactonase YvrE
MHSSEEISRREFIRRSVLSAAAVSVGGVLFSSVPSTAAERKPAKLTHYAELLSAKDQGFLNPRGLAFGPDGSLFVCDSGHYQVRKFNPDGSEVKDNFPLGINPFDPPLGEEITEDKLLNFPEDVVVAPDGTIYIASTCAGEVAVFDSGGKRRGTIGILGPRDGELYMPGALALSSDGLLVADSRNARIQLFNADGSFRNACWRVEVPDDGKSPKKDYSERYRDLFRLATSVAVAPGGKIIAADESADSVFIIEPKGFEIMATPIDWNGFKSPGGIAVDDSGEIYVCNTGKSEILVFDSAGAYHHKIESFRFDKYEEKFQRLSGIAIEPATQAVFVTDSLLGRVIKLFPEQIDPKKVERDLKKDREKR